LIGSLPAHERWIKEIRRRNSHGSFISVGDNFHLFDMPGMEPGEGKVREMSKFIAGLPTKHGITTMFTMELPKDILKPGTRPKYTDSKNSGGIPIDSKVNMNVIARRRTRHRLPRTAGNSNRGPDQGSPTRGGQNLMRNYMVYLSGPIAGLTYSESAEWREYVTRCFPPHIQGVSPLRAKRYLNDGRVITANQPPEFPLSTDRAINASGRFDTLRSDAILVNLLGASTVSLGTAMEIAWAYDHKIPIVLAIEPEGNPHDHPMLRDCISVRVASLDEAIEAITAIVSPHESLVWTRIEQNQMLREEGRLDLRWEPLKENDGGSLRTN
jgi:hypothetical protein